MRKHLFDRCLASALALMLVLSVLPAAAAAAESARSLAADDVTLDETAFEYTGQEIRPNVTVRVNGLLLTLDEHYTLDFANNVEVGTAAVLVTGIPAAGYEGTVEHPFFIREKDAEEPERTLITLTGEMVAIEAEEYPYSGQPIVPAVTVTVEGKVLENGRDYAVEYVNNLIPGTGTVIVRGIVTASDTLGYTGEVRKDFTIRPMTEEEYPLTEIKAADVTINGKTFPYTGEAIEPEITVTVEGKVLTAGKDYHVRYVNNVEAGTGSAIVTGIATATEFGGYTGEVEVTFTITEASSEDESDTAPSYKITKGEGGIWYQESTSALSFTADGAYADFTGVSVDGKALSKDDYAAKEGTIVLLKNEFLKTLDTGKHTITIHFEDGDAEGSFRVAEGDENPKTGDASFLWFGLMTVSAAAVLLLRRKIAM